MSFTPPTAAAERFLADDHVATLVTLRHNGFPHAVPVRFTWDGAAGLVRVMTARSHRKAANVAADPGGRAAICQVAGFRWVTLEGHAVLSDDPARVAEGIRRYRQRYSSPPPNPPGLVVIEIAVDRVLGLNV